MNIGTAISCSVVLVLLVINKPFRKVMAWIAGSGATQDGSPAVAGSIDEVTNVKLTSSSGGGFLTGWLAGIGWVGSIRVLSVLCLGEFLCEPRKQVFDETAEFGRRHTNQRAFHRIPGL